MIVLIQLHLASCFRSHKKSQRWKAQNDKHAYSCSVFCINRARKKKKNILPSTKDLKSLVQPAISAIPFPCRFFRQNRTKIKLLAATIMGSSTQKLYLCSLSSDAEFYRSVRTSGFIALTTSWKSRVRFFWKTNFAPRHPFFQTLGFLGQMDFGNGSQRNVKSSGRNQTDLAGLWWRISDVPRAQAKPPLNAMFCDMFWQIKTLQNFMNHAQDHGKSCRKPLENHWNQVKQLFPLPKKKMSSIIPQFVPFLMLGFQTRHQKHSIWNPPWWLAHNALQDHQGFLRKGLGYPTRPVGIWLR